MCEVAESKPLPQPVEVMSWERHVVAASQVEQRRRPYRALEVQVELRLGSRRGVLLRVRRNEHV
jgi:hypothetical protein